MYVGMDMGGSNTRIVAFDTLDQTRFDVLARFPTEKSYEEQLQRIVDTVKCLPPEVKGIGLAVGAQLNRDGLAVDKTYTMPDFSGKPLVEDVSQATGLPVRAANDNVCANLSETAYGVLAPYERAAYLTVSTGTGAGIRLGDPHTAAFLYLAQVGHHVIDRAGERCTCGQLGCVQTITGGQAILRRYGVPASQLQDDGAWHAITETIAVAIVNLARITRVEAICVGGGIGCNAPYFRDHLANMVRDQSPGLRLTIHFPTLGEDAPVIGTLALWRHDLKITVFH